MAIKELQLTEQKRILYGTRAERLAMTSEDEAALVPTQRFIETDTGGSEYEWYGEWVGTRLKGADNTHDADVHTRALNLPVVQCTGNTTNPANPITADDITIDVAVGTGINFPVGTQISITDGPVKETVLFIVTGQAVDTLTLDMPVGFSYSTAATIEECLTNMAVSGTLVSPQVYTLGPPSGQVWHIIRFIINMTHNSAAADNLFGDQVALTNGVVFRLANGVTANFTNWKSNSDMAGDFFDLVYAAKIASSDFGTRGRGSIKIGSGAIARLDGTAGDKLEIAIQDNLTGLNTFRIKFQGHIEGQ